jgi:hypothetical protein
MPKLAKNGKQRELDLMGKQHFSLQKRTDLLAAYAASGLTIKKYAAQNGIGYSTIQRWLRECKAATAPNNNPLLSNASRTHSHAEHIACTARCDNTADFVDITRHLSYAPTSLTKNNAHDADFSEYSDASPTISTSSGSRDASTTTTATAAAHDESSPLSAPPLCDRLDVFLPNGICIILYQTGIDARTQLIKALV